jgi:hypothetical protein
MAKHTPGPWIIWEGPHFEGGGADLCIGAGGDKWLADMDHRIPRCPQIMDNGHNGEECNICSIDANGVTDEQRANAKLIAAAPDMLIALNLIIGCFNLGGGDIEEAVRNAISKATT